MTATQQHDTAADGSQSETKRWRVTCVQRRHDIASADVEAMNEDDACAAALEELNDDWDAWEPEKRAGETYVDSIEAVGHDRAGRIAIPSRYKAEALTDGAPTRGHSVVVVLKEGRVQSVHIPEELHGLNVRVEDEDTEDTDIEDVNVDTDGREYTVSTWP